MNNTTDQYEAIHCAFCGVEVTEIGNVENIPAVDDRIGWTILAHEHLPNCEWVTSRAYRVERRDY